MTGILVGDCGQAAHTKQPAPQVQGAAWTAGTGCLQAAVKQRGREDRRRVADRIEDRIDLIAVVEGSRAGAEHQVATPCQIDRESHARRPLNARDCHQVFVDALAPQQDAVRPTTNARDELLNAESRLTRASRSGGVNRMPERLAPGVCGVWPRARLG